MPKYFLSKLGNAEKSENLIAISEYIHSSLLLLMGDIDQDERVKRIAKIEAILVALTNEKKLQFSDAIKNIPFKSFLDNFFLDFAWESQQEDKKKGKKGSQFEMEEYFGKQYKELMSNLSNLEKLDQETAAKSKSKSVIDILSKNGFLSASEPFYPGDLQMALDGYTGAHGLVTVLSDISLYTKNSPDKDAVKLSIEEQKKAAQQDQKNHRILIPTNNGTYHFVFLDITIQPLGTVTTCLRDSKKKENVSAEHKEKNNIIIANIQEIAGVPFEAKVEYTGEDPGATLSPKPKKKSEEEEKDSKQSIIYTGEQGENANCPFYSVREVVRVFSRPPFDRELKLSGQDNLAEAAASKDIVKMQLAMVKKVATKRKEKDNKAVNFDIHTLEIDELGILHTVPPTAAYLKHKKVRAMYDFMGKIKAFEQKIDGLQNADEKQAGEELVKILSRNVNNLFQEEDKTTKQDVQQQRNHLRQLALDNCITAIETAKDQLGSLNSTGWKLLANIALGVIGAATLWIVPSIHNCITGRSWFFETPASIKAVENLEGRFNKLIKDLNEKAILSEQSENSPPRSPK